MADTKPDLLIDEEGVCSASRTYEHRKEVDWAQRRRELDQMFPINPDNVIAR